MTYTKFGRVCLAAAASARCRYCCGGQAWAMRRQAAVTLHDVTCRYITYTKVGRVRLAAGASARCRYRCRGPAWAMCRQTPSMTLGNDATQPQPQRNFPIKPPHKLSATIQPNRHTIYPTHYLAPAPRHLQVGGGDAAGAARALLAAANAAAAARGARAGRSEVGPGEDSSDS